MSGVFIGRQPSVTHLSNGRCGIVCRSKTLTPVVTKTAGEGTCKGGLHAMAPRKRQEQMVGQRRLAGKRDAANPYVQRKFGNLNLQPREF